MLEPSGPVERSSSEASGAAAASVGTPAVGVGGVAEVAGAGRIVETGPVTGSGPRATATSAGLLLYRRSADGTLEVLLGHMGGPYWSHKEVGAWTVPKGEHGPDEDPHAAAVREFTEEIGTPPPAGTDLALGSVRQRAGKTVVAWARAGYLDPADAVSNLVEVEWPPRSGRRIAVPELDRVAWLPVARAREVVVRAQAELFDRLVEALGRTAGSGPS